MPGTYRLEEWLEAAEPIFIQAVKWRNIRWQQLDDMGGVFLLAALAVKERNARASDDREMARRAADAWAVFEDKIRADAAEVGDDRAVEYHFKDDDPGLLFSTELRDKFDMPRAQSTEELRDYRQLVWDPGHGQIPKWQAKVLDWAAYREKVIATLRTGPGSAAVAGTVAMAKGGMTPSREHFEAGMMWSGIMGLLADAVAPGAIARKARSKGQMPYEPKWSDPEPPKSSGPSRPVAADIRPAREPEVVKPKDRGVRNSSRAVERGPSRILGPPAPEPPPGPPPAGARRRPAARTTPAAAASTGGPQRGRGAPRSRVARGRGGRGSGPSPEVTIVEAAIRAGLNRLQRNAIWDSLSGVMNRLPGLIGQNRLTIWRGSRTDPRRNSVVDYVAGAIVAEHLMIHDDLFAQTLSELRELAARKGLGSSVQIVQGAVQAKTGTSFGVTPGRETPEQKSLRSEEVGDGMFVVIVDQKGSDGRRNGLKDIYILGVAECKLESQVRYLPNQLPQDRERLESMGVRIGNDVYMQAEHAKPDENRLFTAADLDLPMRWIVAAPYDARKPTGWRKLQASLDKAVGQPAGSVRTIRLPLSNAEIRKYAEHLLDILVDDVLTENEGVKGQPARPRR